MRDVAKTAGVSYASARQARLAESSPNYRTPPADWEKAIAQLARERARELLGLAEELELGGLEGLEG